MNALDHSQDWGRRGFLVFPCDPATKAPLIKAKIGPDGEKVPRTGGLYAASNESEDIERMFRRRPDAAIGVRTGREAGFFVIDLDRPKAEGRPDGVEAWERLARKYGYSHFGLGATTPSGGVHLYFRYPADRTVTNSPGNLAGLGIDVRGDGGYVLAPPSRRPDGAAYAFLEPLDGFEIPEAPKWLLDLIAPRDSQKPVERPHVASATSHAPAPVTPVSAAQGRAYGVAALDGIAQDLAATPRLRNEAANRAAFRAGQLVGAGLVDPDEARERLTQAATANGYVSKDGRAAAVATIDSGLAAGIAQPRQIELRANVAPRTAAQRPEAVNTNDDERTEDAVALQFARLHRDQLLFDHDAGAWFQWDGASWRQNRTAIAFQAARELAREMAAEQSPSKRVVMAKTSFAAGVERYCRSDPVFATTSEGWDLDPLLIGTPGGTFDVRTNALREPDPTDRITRTTSVAPAATADCPTWLRFLNDATGEDAAQIRFMQQLSGYVATGDVSEQVLPFVYGPGGNGKSIFVNVLSRLLGGYAITAPMETFTATKGEQHPTGLAMLRGARLVTASETEEGRAWAEARIKSITGGDKITARFMRQDYFTYTPTFKPLIIGNNKPTLTKVDDAVRRRFLIIPFTRRPKVPDPHLETKLMAEGPQILRWIFDGAQDWLQNRLSRPDCVLAATNSYFSEQDLLQQWVDEELDIEPENDWRWETSADLFASWEAFARRAGETPGTRKGFSDQLLRLGLTPARRDRVRAWIGVKIKRPQSGRVSDE